MLGFQNLQNVNYIFKMAASIVMEVRILIFGLLELSYLYPILIRLWQIAWLNKDLHFRFTCFQHCCPLKDI